MAKILIIDDAEWSRDYVSGLLKEKNHEVTVMADSVKAVRNINLEEFDLLITDIFMPGVDGLEIVAAIQKLKNKPKILVMSGGSGRMAAEDVLLSASYMKADATLKKPFGPDDFYEILEELLQS